VDDDEFELTELVELPPHPLARSSAATSRSVGVLLKRRDGVLADRNGGVLLSMRARLP